RERDTIGQPVPLDERLDPRTILAVAANHRTNALARWRGERLDEEIHALERCQPRHQEHVVVVAVAAIVALWRWRIEDRRLEVRPHREPLLSRAGLHEEPRHVPR